VMLEVLGRLIEQFLGALEVLRERLQMLFELQRQKNNF
jgi:hypothetical protein